jgi:DNA-binding XRE family transcriptional regulator
VLGKHLKQAWLNADTTQVELAEQMGISRKAFLTAEKGKVQFETLITIMKALQLTEQLKNPFRFKTSLQLNWLSYKGANDNELPNKKHQMCRSHLNGKAVVNVHYDDRVIGAVNFDTE